ncbi:MAG: sulfite exporter TauE/SafE family protein [Gracilibacteraceae bacterium]|jgi:sulfite exporter TauE/SafE/copper chaperone CopZ|nr:sulfite exporter TauE/SafE family protein [Gracilibacteraceae bacterium]
MATAFKSARLRIGGMTCLNCQHRIEKKLRALKGVASAHADNASGATTVTYDAGAVTPAQIIAAVEALGYQVLTAPGRETGGAVRAAGFLIIIAALYLFLQRTGLLSLTAPERLAETDMSYGVLFVIGLLTSAHCLAMCGGINLSQCGPARAAQAAGGGGLAPAYPALLYNLGRIAAYTAIGFIAGALGAVVSFSPGTQGALKILAGIFMAVMGVNMLGLFPQLRRLIPRPPGFFARLAGSGQAGGKGPLYVGLLNGLMPCGPLQAMQLYALSTGSPSAGALAMLLFGLGTAPLVFGLGAAGAVLGKKFAPQVVAAGATLVVVLGISMFSQGWSLAGLSLDGLTPPGATAARSGEISGEISGGSAGEGPVMENGSQVVRSALRSGRYPNIAVQAETPVKWIIDAPQGSINGCNNRMIISEYGIEYKFQPGENIIEFTPAEAGLVRYSCWMGMIRGTINVLASEDAAVKTR